MVRYKKKRFDFLTDFIPLDEHKRMECFTSSLRAIPL